MAPVVRSTDTWYSTFYRFQGTRITFGSPTKVVILILFSPTTTIYFFQSYETSYFFSCLLGALLLL